MMPTTGLNYQDQIKAGINPYCSSKRTFALFLIVLTAHFFIYVLPFILFKIYLDLHPEPIVIQVGIAEPLGESLDIPKDADGPAPAPEPEPVKQPEPEPVQQPEPVKQPEPEPVQQPEPEPVTLPKEEPIPIPEPPKKPEKKPEKKKLTADDIRKSFKPVKQDSKKRKQQQAEERRRKTEAIQAELNRKRVAAERAKYIAKLKNAMTGSGNSEKKYGTRTPGEKGVKATREFYEYYDKLKNFIQPKWIQPNVIQLNGQKPSVTIELDIQPDGSLRSARITNPSGIPAMDDSIKNLIQSLRVLPVPPQAMKVALTLRIND